MKKLFTFLAFTGLAIVAQAQNGEKWSAVGDFNYDGNPWHVTLVAYDDGTYTLQDWYGYEGYDISFTINEDGSLHFIDFLFELNEYDHYVVYEAFGGHEIGFYQDKNSGFEGNEQEGQLWFGGEMREKVTLTWPGTNWTTQGLMTITGANGTTEYTTNICSTTDNGYRLENWASVSGYSLLFKVNDDGTINITNGFTIGSAQENVTTVIGTDSGMGIKLYTNTDSSFEGSQAEGHLTFKAVNGDEYDFVWPYTPDGVLWSTFGDLYIPKPKSPINKQTQLQAYKDGSFRLLNWFDEGYDLYFNLNEDGTLHYLEGQLWWDDVLWSMAMGNSTWAPGEIEYGFFYQDSNSHFTQNEDDGSGELWFCEYTLCDRGLGDMEPITFKWGPIAGWGDSAVSEIESEPMSVVVYGSSIMVPEGARVYDMQGRRVDPYNVSNSVYVVTNGKTSIKVKVGK